MLSLFVALLVGRVLNGWQRQSVKFLNSLHVIILHLAAVLLQHLSCSTLCVAIKYRDLRMCVDYRALNKQAVKNKYQ